MDRRSKTAHTHNQRAGRQKPKDASLGLCSVVGGHWGAAQSLGASSVMAGLLSHSKGLGPKRPGPQWSSHWESAQPLGVCP